MATASDDFNRANSPNLGANWTQLNALDISIDTNEAVNLNVGGSAQLCWNLATNTFGADQFSQWTIRAVPPGSFIYVIVRASGSAGGGDEGHYDLRTDLTNTTIRKTINTVGTQLQDCGVGFSVGDVMRLEIRGNVLKAYKNGVQIGTDQASGSELASGQPGIRMFDASVSADNWSGGDLDPLPASGIPFTTMIDAKRI